MSYKQNTDFINKSIFLFPRFFFWAPPGLPEGGDGLFGKLKAGWGMGSTVPRFTGKLGGGGGGGV